MPPRSDPPKLIDKSSFYDRMLTDSSACAIALLSQYTVESSHLAEDVPRPRHVMSHREWTVARTIKIALSHCPDYRARAGIPPVDKDP